MPTALVAEPDLSVWAVVMGNGAQGFKTALLRLSEIRQDDGSPGGRGHWCHSAGRH